MYHKLSRFFSSLAILVILAMTLTSVGPVYAVTGFERFHVQLTQNNVIGFDWPISASVTMTIDDPGTVPNPDFSDTQTADSEGTVVFDDVGGIDLAEGMYVTMSDGTTTKEHTVTPLSISDIDVDLDTLSGTATPLASVTVAVFDCGEAIRYGDADGSGNWSVDFSILGTQPEEQTLCDIVPGFQGEALESDGDGDHTDIDWRLPNPKFSARPNDEEVVGWDFLLGETVILNIDDPATGTNPDYTNTTTVVVNPGDPNTTWFYFNFSEAYDLKPDDIVTVTDGTNTKNHVVTHVAVTSADAASDTVSGTAEIASYAYTEVCDESDCYRRHELVDGSGDWTADFSVPGDEPGEDTTYDLQPGDSGWVIQWDGDGDETLISWRIRNPIIGARANNDNLEGWDWPVGPTLTIDIDDPGTGPGSDYSTTTTAAVAPWDPDQTYFNLDLNNIYDIKTGDEVSVTDGSTTKYLTVTELEITHVDPATDVVTGVAAPGSEVTIWACWDGGCTDNRIETADGSGDWSTDFSDGSGGQPTYDIQLGDWVDSGQWDAEGDGTFFGINVTVPGINARANENYVRGYDWDLGASVTLEIDDPDSGVGVDYTDTQTVITAPWDPSQTTVEFHLSGIYDLQPADEISLTDGSTTKTLIVTELEVTSVDPGTDVVSGTAAPFSEVEVNVCDEFGCANRFTTADTNGDWSADFSTPGGPGEEDIWDIVPGTGGDSAQYDEDGDSTRFGWNVPPSTLHAVPSHPEVHGHDWPYGVSITMYVDDDDNLGNGYLHTDTQPAVPGGCGDPCFDLLGVFNLQVGQYVTFTDGSVTKVVQVSVLHVTDIDTDNETISGIADPGSDVMVNIHSEPHNLRHVVAAGDGTWTVDFSIPGDEDSEDATSDLRPGDHGRAIQLNPDGSDDGTLEYWGIPNPRIEARTNANSVEGYEWDLGVSVTLEIDDPDNGVGVDHTDTQTVIQAPWDSSQTYVEFTFNGVYDLQPGDEVSLSDGSTTKYLTVTELEITDIDSDTDVVTGVAAPGSVVEIWACGETDCVGNRVATADGSGDWSTDFSDGGGGQPTYDIQRGDWVDSGQWDAEGDGTLFGENAPNPLIVAQYPSNIVTGRGWQYGTSVTLEVDDPANGLGVDFSDTQTVGWAPFNPSLTYVEFDIGSSLSLGPGLQLSMTDGTVTKELTTANLEVTSVDMASDVISGTADPYTDLNIFVLPGGSFGRHEQADGAGNWSADFSAPGDEDWENNTYDIQSADFGMASVPDNDSDETRYYWYAPPIVSSITRADPSPTSASTVNFAVTFSEDVTGVTVDDFTPFTTGSISGYSVTGISGSGSVYTVTVATGMYNGTLRLDVNSSGTGIKDLNGTDLEGGFTSGEVYTVEKIYTMTLASQKTYDGWVRESGEYTEKGGSKNKLGKVLQVGDDAADRQYRSILSFGTAAIPDNAVITSVILKVKKAGVVGTNPMNTHKGLFVDIRKGKFYTKKALQIQDFQANANKLKAGKFANKLYSGWYKSVLYAGALPYINVKGITQFRLRFLLDDNDDLSADILKLYSGNSVLANRPQLIVKYYVP